MTIAYRNYVLILFLVFINEATISAMGRGCTNSCGKLNHIPYPFRVPGDPEHCGEPDFELICEDNGDSGAALYFDGHKYLVTDITNPFYFSFGFITIKIDCPFTKSTCRVRDNSTFRYLDIDEIEWATFMSCSRRIENTTYMLVPSLSDENSTMYVIIGSAVNKVKYLHESCRFVDIFPFSYGVRANSSKEVIERLQNGTVESWYLGAVDLGNCWTFALRFAKFDMYEGRTTWARLYPFGVYYRLLGCFGVKACHKNQICQVKLSGLAYFSQFIVASLIVVIYAAIALVLRFGLAPLSMLVFIINDYQKNRKPLDKIEKFLLKEQILSPRRYTYGDIIAMTKHFNERIGKGGFGEVYKGELLGTQLVAIKVLNGSKLDGEEFINEVSTIGRIHHVNVVRLLGFCSEGTKRALIYEYMPNGSLDKYIFSSRSNSDFSLTPDTLYNIALGVARGINYLHNGCDTQILHFDIKPQNILLDHNYIPKISDFGLAKLHSKEHNVVSVSVARGTIGYMAPEMISRSFGAISDKTDVYSFGMLILDIAGKRRKFNNRVQNSIETYYPSWIYDRLTQLSKSNFSEIIDIEDLELKLCKVGLWCIQMNSSKRLAMGEVVELLQNDAKNLEMPPKPFFTSTDTAIEAHSFVSSFSMEMSTIIVHD